MNFLQNGVENVEYECINRTIIDGNDMNTFVGMTEIGRASFLRR